MVFQIMYKFIGDEGYHTCYVTYEQYVNLKEVPSIQECSVIKKNQKQYEAYIKEMQDAIDSAVKNDTSHIKALSECV